MQSSNPLIALLRSRKFLLLVLDTVISLILYYQAVDPVLIGLIQPVFVTLIGGIAYEDGQQKGAATVVNAGTVDRVDASTTTGTN